MPPRKAIAAKPAMLMLCGLDDSGRQPVLLGPDEKVLLQYPGHGCLHEMPLNLKGDIRRVWLGGKRPDTSLPRLQRAVLVNAIADPDRLGKALDQAERIYASAGKPRCFNAPTLVARLRQDRASEILSGVPGLQVLPCVRLRPQAWEDFVLAAQEGKIGFPAQVRVAGLPPASGQLRLEKAADSDRLHAVPWQGRPAYISPLKDFADADAVYRVHRILMINGTPYLTAFLLSKQWQYELDPGSEAFDVEETQMLKTFETDSLPHFKPVLEAIHRRIGMEAYGLDLHVQRDGSLLLLKIFADIDVKNIGPTARPHRQQACMMAREALVTLMQRFARRQ